MSRIHLVDASPYIFRAYFSLPDSIQDPSGRPVHAIYGFATFLLKLVEDEAATHLATAFDESLTSSFRNEIYADYKSRRELPPEDLKAQLDDCRQLAAALGVPAFRSARYEAEDLLAALVPSLVEDGHEVVVVSADKDLLQLVGPRVTMLDFARDTRYAPADVEEKFGVRPEQITDYLGLAGDAVDDIPGVPGVGKKTAAALLARFDRIEDALADLDAVAALDVRGAKSLAKTLDTHRERALLSKRLATLAGDEATAEASATLDELALGDNDADALEALIERLGFGRLAERLRSFGARSSGAR